MTNTLRDSLIEGEARLGVWGCGYIGFTTMINFAQEGVRSIGHDLSPKVVEAIGEGRIHIPNLGYWIGYDIEPLIKSTIEATPDWKGMMAEDIRVHLIAVPTEQDGEPWHDPLQDVMDKLCHRKVSAQKPDLIIIESTLTPGMFDTAVVGTLEAAGFKVGREFLVGIAPRRDWFDSPEKNLKALPRVIGGTDTHTSEVMKEVLGIVCNNLIMADDTHTVEMVKSVENSILHICATYASQLARAYPDVNITEVLRLASTHWRIPRYYPSVGTGGYCIPVSSKYVKGGAPQPEFLGLTNETLEFDYNQPRFVADLMADRAKGKNIGILGISYKRDLRVHTLSPALRIIERLKERGMNVSAFDPYYTAEAMQQIAGIDTLEYPEGLKDCDGIIIVPPHRVFCQTPKAALMKHLKKGQAILDNEGAWEKWRGDLISQGIDYHRIGDKGWCIV